ncbi:HDOD domain-containing protein [Zoogloea sp.]|uniref:HDOD domain-containing protein n=1 Tax=Zoogloea sp. TaxID=49181 RepID=UPI00262E8B08|nr:HDOD domain-containing protein [Zoogloea sp.]MDD3353113.1 HDOD domain-containing protein [Zoogloea sp.]
MSTNKSMQSLADWVARIRDKEMPVFGRTVESLRALLNDERASAAALAKVILMDPAMTSKVLRLANSAFFNHSHQAVSTVSRAIVVVGFNPVAELALSVALIDSLLAGGIRSRVQIEMARSFHAAVQARWVAQKHGDGAVEEVFIAGLLTRVGEMAFWCFGGDPAEALDRCLTEGRMREDEAQQHVLGFPLRQLSVGLVREWKLGTLAAAVLEFNVRSRGAERAVLLGQRIVRAAEVGWAAPAGQAVLRELVDYLGMPAAAIEGEIAANSQEAARVAGFFGASEAAALIPRRPAAMEAVQSPVVPTGPDPGLQLRILHELGEMVLTGASLPDILQLVLEGIYRGVGCERAVLALLSEDGLHLVGRLALGPGADALCAAFSFSMDGDPDDALDAAIDSGLAWRAGGVEESPRRYERLCAVTGSTQSCLVPFGGRGRRIGIFYAERRGQAFDDDAWRAIRHFALQVNLAIRAGMGGQGLSQRDI